MSTHRSAVIKLIATSAGILSVVPLFAQTAPNPSPSRAIPKTWDDRAMSSVEVPLADPAGSIRFVPSDYYYKMRVRPIFKSYAVYAPGREPKGYVEWLKQQQPVVIWDDATHKPPLATDADWIAAGEMVFQAPLAYDGNSIIKTADLRDPAWHRYIGGFAASNGAIPNVRYVIREKGKLELGSFSCALCHATLSAAKASKLA